MDELLIILIAVAAAALVWGIACALGALTAGKKRKLHDRLSVESHSRLDGSPRTIVLQSQATGLPPFVSMLRPMQVLQRRVGQAFPDLSLARFLLIVIIFAAVLGPGIFLLMGNVILAVVIGAFGAYLPFLVVWIKRSRKHKLLTSQLPEALEFLSRVLRAGQSFSTGLQMMSDELPQPLASEFRRCYDQHSLGQPLEDGLRDMAIRLESPDFAFFATAVVIQRQSGGDMSEVLSNISQMIRQRLRLQQSVKAKTAEGRFTGYIMLAFPVVMFLLAWFLNPTYGGTLIYTSTGHILLGVAVGLQIIGMFLIKKITTVRV